VRGFTLITASFKYVRDDRQAEKDRDKYRARYRLMVFWANNEPEAPEKEHIADGPVKSPKHGVQVDVKCCRCLTLSVAVEHMDGSRCPRTTGLAQREPQSHRLVRAAARSGCTPDGDAALTYSFYTRLSK
jgi:hypothetical protein